MALPENLHLRDDDQEIGGVDDMTKLTYLNEPEVLFNLERRYGLNDIYVSLYNSILVWLQSVSRMSVIAGWFI